MRQIVHSALLAFLLALPASAQFLSIHGILVEPRNPTPSDRIRLTVVGIEGCGVGFHEPVYESASGSVVLNTVTPDCVATPIPRPLYQTLEIGPLPAGRHFAELRAEGDFLFWRELFEVSEAAARLDLGEDDRFQVSVQWSNPRDGSSGSGQARRLARDSGAFSFFSPDNLEVTVKILDGRAVNGHWWVFLASMTDLELKVTVLENRDNCLLLPVFPPACPTKTYTQAAGKSNNTVDVNAFEEKAPVLASPLPGDLPSVRIEPLQPISSAPVHVAVSVLASGDPALHFAGVQDHRIVFEYLDSDVGPPTASVQTADATVGPLPAGVYAVEVRRNEELDFNRTFEVAGVSADLILRQEEESFFMVVLRFVPPPGSGSDGIPVAVPITRESGYFTFFGPDNVEVTVKILDGRAVNGRYWVFISGMTDLEFTATVRHCAIATVGVPWQRKGLPEHAGREPDHHRHELHRTLRWQNRSASPSRSASSTSSGNPSAGWTAAPRSPAPPCLPTTFRSRAWSSCGWSAPRSPTR